jgi:hypothetical protein
MACLISYLNEEIMQKQIMSKELKLLILMACLISELN